LQAFAQFGLNCGFVYSALGMCSGVTAASIPVIFVVTSVIVSVRELIPMKSALFLSLEKHRRV